LGEYFKKTVKANIRKGIQNEIQRADRALDQTDFGIIMVETIRFGIESNGLRFLETLKQVGKGLLCLNVFKCRCLSGVQTFLCFLVFKVSSISRF